MSQKDGSMSRMIVMPSAALSSSGSDGQDEYVVRSRPCSDYLDSGSDQMDTRSTSVCSDSGEEPAYDCPHMCECVDLGDGEFVDGYRE